VTVQSLRLPASVVDAMVGHARAEAPNEACGLLSGDRGSGLVTRFHPARNALASPTAFDVHPEDLVRTLYEIEERGEELVATFHSHPRTAAVPSATDLRNAAYPVPLVIVSLRDDPGACRAWVSSSRPPEEIPVAVLARDRSASSPGDVHDASAVGVHRHVD
jgi:proteasome lid subunit RPN8/RPN11